MIETDMSLAWLFVCVVMISDKSDAGRKTQLRRHSPVETVVLLYWVTLAHGMTVLARSQTLLYTLLLYSLQMYVFLGLGGGELQLFLWGEPLTHSDPNIAYLLTHIISSQSQFVHMTNKSKKDITTCGSTCL